MSTTASKATVTTPPQTEAISTAIQKVQDLADKYALDVLKTHNNIEQAIMVADGIQALKREIRPLMPKLTALANTKLGFLTDRDPNKKRGDKLVEPYAAEVVENCIVEALMRGVHVCGNHFNIIAGGCMIVQQGYKFLVQNKVQGLTDLETYVAPPQVIGGQLTCRCSASWKIGDIRHQLKDSQGRPGAVYAVKIYEGQGADAAVGKAERRMFKAIWERSTGSIFTESDHDTQEVDPTGAPIEGPKTQTQQVLENVQKNNPTPAPSAAAPASTLPTGPITQGQIQVIAALNHVVQPEEFNLMLEEYGVFEVKQLSAENAYKFIQRLEKIHGGAK